jgi:hypothetical protein
MAKALWPATLPSRLMPTCPPKDEPVSSGQYPRLFMVFDALRSALRVRRNLYASSHFAVDVVDRVVNDVSSKVAIVRNQRSGVIARSDSSRSSNSHDLC